jgi:hypothetical protein
MSVAPGRLSQGPDDVHPPHGERPCDGDRLEGVRWEISLAGIELAPIAGAHNLVGVGDRGGPVEALAECVATSVRGTAWSPHTPAWMSRRSSHPWGMGMHRCRTPNATRLYSSLSMRVNDLAILAMRLALEVPLDPSRQGTWPTSLPRGGLALCPWSRPRPRRNSQARRV